MLPMMVSPALMGVKYRLMLNEFAGVVPLYFEMLGFYVNSLGPENIYTTVVVIEVLQWTPSLDHYREVLFSGNTH